MKKKEAEWTVDWIKASKETDKLAIGCLLNVHLIPFKKLSIKKLAREPKLTTWVTRRSQTWTQAWTKNKKLIFTQNYRCEYVSKKVRVGPRQILNG